MYNKSYLNNVSQSKCGACYENETSYESFRDCWLMNPTAHEFPKGGKMMTGSFKVCFIGILGASSGLLQEIKQEIGRYATKLTTTDIVTSIELGMPGFEQIIDAEDKSRVKILRDELRPALINETGRIIVGSPGDIKSVYMDSVLEKDIRLITRSSIVRVKHVEDPLYNQRGTACLDGDLFGWCSVTIDSKNYKLPSIWLEVICLEPPEDPKWEFQVCVPVHLERTVPDNSTGTNIQFQGDSSKSQIDEIENDINSFDPMHVITPKIFKTFDLSMREWVDTDQKNAIIQCLFEHHQLDPTEFFPKEQMVEGMVVNFSWPESIGSQSVFEGVDGYTYVVDNTDASILAQARIGKVRYGECEWETPAPHKVGAILELSSRNDFLFVPGCRICHRYDSSRTGRLWNVFIDNTQNPPQKVGHLHWDSSPNIVVQKNLSKIERLFLMNTVSIKTSMLSGKILPFLGITTPKYIRLDFTRRSTIGDRVGIVWFNHNELAKQRMYHRLTAYMSYPYRVARFTVQERVGMSIETLDKLDIKVWIRNIESANDLFKAINIFCNGLAQMHYMKYLHADAHSGNITFTVPDTGGKFGFKLIDFDRLHQIIDKRDRYGEFAYEFMDITSSLILFLNQISCQIEDGKKFKNNLESHITSLKFEIMFMIRNTSNNTSTRKSDYTSENFKKLADLCKGISVTSS